MRSNGNKKHWKQDAKRKIAASFLGAGFVWIFCLSGFVVVLGFCLCGLVVVFCFNSEGNQILGQSRGGCKFSILVCSENLTEECSQQSGDIGPALNRQLDKLTSRDPSLPKLCCEAIICNGTATADTGHYCASTQE